MRVINMLRIPQLFKLGNKHATFKFLSNVTHASIPEISSNDIKKAINSKNMPLEEGYTSFITPCTLCKKASKKNTSKLYINKTTGSFLCPTCVCNGSWNELEKQWNSANSNSLPKNNNEHLTIIETYLKNVETSTLSVEHVDSTTYDTIFNEANLPVPIVVVQNARIRVSKDFKTLYFPLEDAERKTVGYLLVNQNEITINPNGISTGILHAKSSRQKEAAVVVPNVSDFLALLNAKISSNIICLPHGVQCLPQQILPSLEKYNKLILWFGNDISSWDCARNFAKKLDEKRCYFVRPFENQLLPHLMSKENIKSAIESAQPIWHKSIINFAALRDDVYADLQNIDKVEGVKWTRYPALNNILKGHRKGELTVLTGPTGSGKTTFVSEYSLDLAMQGVSTLWGSFEIRNTRLARTMLQQMAGVPLQDNLNQFNEFADQFEKLPIHFMTFHGQQSIKIVMEAVEHAQYVHDIAHVIVDNVQFMMGITEEARHMDRFWKQDAIIAAFRTFATRKNCHVTLVIHPRKEREEADLTTSSIFGGAKASQEADNVLLIQDKRLSSLKGKKYLQIAKNRYSGDVGVIPLEFDKECLSFVPKKKPEKRKMPTVKGVGETNYGKTIPTEAFLDFDNHPHSFPIMDETLPNIKETAQFVCENSKQPKQKQGSRTCDKNKEDASGNVKMLLYKPVPGLPKTPSSK